MRSFPKHGSKEIKIEERGEKCKDRKSIKMGQHPSKKKKNREMKEE